MTKTLIIATGRCGSSALARAIKENYLCDEWYDEPFNPDLNTTNEITGIRELNEYGERIYDFTAPWEDVPPNTVWKCLLTLKNYPKQIWDEKPIEEFFVDFAKKFENVILLSRRNHAERLYSMLHGIQHSTWHFQYYPKKITVMPGDTFIQINDFMEQNRRLEYISEKLNKKIFYYEDLFTDQETSEKTWSEMIGNVNDYEATWLRWLQPKLRYQKDLYQKGDQPK